MDIKREFRAKDLDEMLRCIIQFASKYKKMEIILGEINEVKAWRKRLKPINITLGLKKYDG